MPYTLLIPSRQLWGRAGAPSARAGTAVQGLWSPVLRQAGATVTTHLSVHFGAQFLPSKHHIRCVQPHWAMLLCLLQNETFQKAVVVVGE